MPRSTPPRRWALAMAAVFVTATTAGAPNATAAPAARPDVPMPAGRYFPPGTSAAEMKPAVAALYAETIARATAAATAAGIDVDAPTPAEIEATAGELVTATVALYDAGNTAVETTAVSSLGADQEEENTAPVMAGPAPYCPGNVTAKKRKLPFSPLYLNVRIHLDELCPETVLYCAMSGFVSASAWPWVFGSTSIDRDVYTSRCQVTTTPSWLTSRPCFAAGVGVTIPRSDGYYWGPWGFWC